MLLPSIYLSIYTENSAAKLNLHKYHNDNNTKTKKIVSYSYLKSEAAIVEINIEKLLSFFLLYFFPSRFFNSVQVSIQFVLSR